MCICLKTTIKNKNMYTKPTTQLNDMTHKTKFGKETQRKKKKKCLFSVFDILILINHTFDIYCFRG